MTTEQLLSLNCKSEENKEMLQRALRKIKPFAKYENEEVPLEILEKFIYKMTSKYNVDLQWITYSRLDNNEPYWSASLKKGSPNHNWIGTVYGISIYELLCKFCILMYSSIKKGDVEERKEEE